MPYPSKPKNQLLDPNLGEQTAATAAIRPALAERPVSPSQGTAGAPRIAGSPWNREKVMRPQLQQERLPAGVVAPPMWTAQQVLSDERFGKVAQGLRERLLRTQDTLSEKKRATPFWKEFRSSPESVAGRMLSLVVSELTQRDRTAAFPNLGQEQRTYLENSPVSKWLDWLDDVNAKRGGTNG